MAPVAQRWGVLNILTSYLISLPLPLGPSSAINLMKMQSEATGMDLVEDVPPLKVFLPNFYQHFLTMTYLKADILTGLLLSLTPLFMYSYQIWLSGCLPWHFCIHEYTSKWIIEEKGHSLVVNRLTKPRSLSHLQELTALCLQHILTAIKQPVGQIKKTPLSLLSKRCCCSILNADDATNSPRFETVAAFQLQFFAK